MNALLQSAACHPISGKRETWLGCKNGFGICLICFSLSGYGRGYGRGYARGLGSLLRKSSIFQHSKSEEHIAAREAFMQRLRATDSQDPPASVAVFDGQKSAESAKASTDNDTGQHRTSDPAVDDWEPCCRRSPHHVGDNEFLREYG